jgi:putative endonuclease
MKKTMYPSSPSPRSIWDTWEDIAVSYLEKKWYQIIKRNYQIKGWEIDIIAIYQWIYVFIEVKYRRNEDYGHPLDTFSHAKRRTLKRTVMIYLSKHKINPENIQIDFIGIMPKLGSYDYDIWHIEWVEI